MEEDRDYIAEFFVGIVVIFLLVVVTVAGMFATVWFEDYVGSVAGRPFVRMIELLVLVVCPLVGIVILEVYGKIKERRAARLSPLSQEENNDADITAEESEAKDKKEYIITPIIVVLVMIVVPLLLPFGVFLDGQGYYVASGIVLVVFCVSMVILLLVGTVATFIGFGQDFFRIREDIRQNGITLYRRQNNNEHKTKAAPPPKGSVDSITVCFDKDTSNKQETER
jgi:flagellar basal body-associated protein FliL